MEQKVRRYRKVFSPLAPAILLVMILQASGCRTVSREAGREAERGLVKTSTHALTPAARKSVEDAARRAFAPGGRAGEQDAREAAEEALERAFREGLAPVSEEERAKINSKINLAAAAETDPERIEEIKKETLHHILECLYGKDLEHAVNHALDKLANGKGKHEDDEGRQSADEGRPGEGGDCFDESHATGVPR